MIYIKIYLDKNENGEDMLVFDSAKEDSGTRFIAACAHAQERIKQLGSVLKCETKVYGVEGVAISKEAKAFFLELLDDKSAYHKTPFSWRTADITMNGCHAEQNGWNGGEFGFLPPNPELGTTRKTLYRGDHFTVSTVFSTAPLEYMTPGDNELIKALDITAPVDEAVLLDPYYSALYAKEPPAADAETIRKTPLRYLTEVQKEVIRNDYRAMTASYTDRQWYEQGDFLRDEIMGALVVKYLKFNGDLEKIIG